MMVPQSVNTLNTSERHTLKGGILDFPGGPMVKNPTGNAEDLGSIPGPGGSHMLLATKPKPPSAMI